MGDTEAQQRARRFGRALERAIRRAGIRPKRLAIALGIHRGTLIGWRYGRYLPRDEAMVIRLAEALEAPSLATLWRLLLTRSCPSCGRTFLITGTNRRDLVCSRHCNDRMFRARRKERNLNAALNDNEELRDENTMLRETVEAFCRACSDAICRMPECALRPVSPLPPCDDRTEIGGRWGERL